MKCPECGLWNRASLPHCTRCGTPLNIDQASRFAWKDSLKDGGASTTYLRADEFGQTDQTPEPRDALAREMHDLKQRKQRGSELLERLQSESQAPSSERVITEEGAEESPSGTIQKTIVVKQVSESGLRSRRESELRSRVRFMDENGAFVESRSYDPLIPQSFRSTEDSLPRKGRYLPRKKHRILQTVLIVLAALALSVGGYFVINHFASTAVAVKENAPGVVVNAGLLDDLSAHTVLIPGAEGSTIYIRELHASYVVSDGFATVEIPDHIWYDNLEGSLDETMEVTLTPFLKSSSGRQTPLDPIH